jgi:hypothetical protein
MTYHFYFPEEFIALNREIINHPALQERLSKHGNDFELKLAEIAAYCLIEVDGEFTEEDLKRLAIHCTDRLKKMQGINPLDQSPNKIITEDWSILEKKQ